MADEGSCSGRQGASADQGRTCTSIYGNCDKAERAKNGSERGSAGHPEEQCRGSTGDGQHRPKSIGIQVLGDKVSHCFNQEASMSHNGLSLRRDREHRTPPACPHPNIAHSKVAGHGDHGNQNSRADPAQTQLNCFTTLNALLADIRGKSSPAIVRSVDGQTRLVGGLEKPVGPVPGIQPECADVAPDDAFAQDSARKLLDSDPAPARPGDAG